jgi:hypothetical protein
MRSTIAPVLVLGMMMVLLASGCGKGGAHQGAISGEVKLDGRLLERGSITFTPTEGGKGKVAGGPIDKGQYRLAGNRGPTVGWNSVEIRASRKSAKPMPQTDNPLLQGGENTEEAVAPRFNSASTLKSEVKPGENMADFEVSSK